MATKVSITIADSVYQEIEEYTNNQNITRSESYEDLLREGLLVRKGFYARTNIQGDNK